MRFLGLLLLCLSYSAMADTDIKTQIHEVDFGKNMGDEILVLLKSGHVAKIQQGDSALLDRLQKANQKSAWINFKLDQNRYIKSFSVSKASAPQGHQSFRPPMKMHQEYVPTTIESMAKAKSIFKEAKHPAKEETQCFNRAMVWTYEWWKNHSLKSNKILIFFTRNYIRRYNFEWWFHISPYVHVIDENGQVAERVMDAKYTSGPIPFQKWTNIFMNGDPVCPVITKYTQYADNPYSGECMIIRTHMYTYQPADLQMYEAWNYVKEAFNMDEVKGAYLEAFTSGLPEEEGDDDEEEEGTTTGGSTTGRPTTGSSTTGGSTTGRPTTGSSTTGGSGRSSSGSSSTTSSSTTGGSTGSSTTSSSSTSSSTTGGSEMGANSL